MTVKEVAKCLEMNEGFIFSLVRQGFIDFVMVPRSVLDRRKWTIKTIHVFEIDPEEVESIETCIVNGKLVDHIRLELEHETCMIRKIILKNLLDEAEKYKQMITF